MQASQSASAGAEDVAAFVEGRVPLRELPLAAFEQGSAGDVLVRRLLLAANVPTGWLDALDLGGSERLQRWRTSHAYGRGARQAIGDEHAWRQLTHAPIVLLYHAVGADAEPASRYVIPVRRLEQQLTWLRARGYVLLELDELLSCLHGNRLPPANVVVVTFDDAYLDTFTLAFPILRRLGIPATVFAVSGRGGGTNDWEPVGPLAHRPLMSWAQLTTMRSAGVSIGAHSRSHVSLPTIAGSALLAEVGGSRDDLRRELGCEIETFAYPFGHANAEVHAAVKQAGFQGACGVHPGKSDASVSSVSLPRIEMQGTWRLSHFALALHLGHVPGPLAH